MKAILSVALVAAAIAVPFVAPAIAGALGIAGAIGIAAVTGGLEIGISLVSSALLGPSVPKPIIGSCPSERISLS